MSEEGARRRVPCAQHGPMHALAAAHCYNHDNDVSF